MTTQLLSHNSEVIDYDGLREIQTPEPTQTWTPIPHVELLDSVKREVTGSGLKIVEESLAISQAKNGAYGDRFFGLLQMESEIKDEFSVSIGIRNAHDRTLVAGLCVGSRVFVCSNLAFSAEIVISRKHTRRIRADLPRLINSAVGRLGDLRQRQSSRIEAYQRASIDDNQFHDMAIRAMDAKVLAPSKLPKALQEFREPSYPEFRSRTVWSAFNAFTETLKAYDLQDIPRRTQALHGICDMLCRVN